MSKLTDDLIFEQRPRYECKVCSILELLDAEDAAAIRKALVSGPIETVARVLSKNGHPVTGPTIKRHIFREHK